MLGRVKGEIVFDQDRFMSSRHCRVMNSNHHLSLEDLGSTNGTFIRVRDEVVVEHDDLILLGQKIYKIKL